jgi:hypothetical protein
MAPIEEARERAEEHAVFCDGLIEAGLAVIGHRGRYVARLLLEVTDQLEAERSARQALQERWEASR